MIEKFSAERYSDLWRGLGIAITYVGGCGEVALQEILTNAEQYQTQLATGCVMATISRFNAGYIPDDTMIICKLFCNRTAKDLVANFKPISNLLSSNSDSVYQNWISKIEHSF